LIDINNNVILPFEYGKIDHVVEDFFVVTVDRNGPAGIAGLVRTGGEVVIPFGRIAHSYERLFGFALSLSEDEECQLYDPITGATYSCDGFTLDDIKDYAWYLSGTRPITESETYNSNKDASVAKMSVSADGVKKYFSANGEVIIYADGKFLYGANGVIGQSNLAPSLKSVAPNLDMYWIRNISNWNNGIAALNRIPKPLNDKANRYICLMPNNPLVNINGDVVMLEKDDYFLVPLLEDGAMLVPLGAVFKALEADVRWNAETQTVTARKGGTAVTLSIGKNEMSVNGEIVRLDVPARLVGGRAFVPLGAVAEAFGASIEWDEETGTAVICY
jgi:hypothetical protein